MVGRKSADQTMEEIVMFKNFFSLFVAVMLVVGLGTTAMGQVRDMNLEDRWIVPVPTIPEPVDGDDDDQGGGIGEKVAGSWLGSGSFSVDIGCDGSFEIGPFPFTDVHTFGVGGSRTTTNPNNPNTAHGTWVKTGPRQVTGRDVLFINATATDPPFIAIIPMVVNFDPYFENATTSFGALGYLTTQDPLDPTVGPIFCSAGQHDSFRKVSATE